MAKATYLDKLAKFLEQRMPFAYKNGVVNKIEGKGWNSGRYPSFDYYGFDPYSESEPDESFMVGFPRGVQNIHVSDDSGNWKLSPENAPEDFVPRIVPKGNENELAQAIYEEGEKFYPDFLKESRERWNKMIEPEPYPQEMPEEYREFPSREDFLKWRMGYFERNDPNWDYFERKAIRDYNDWEKKNQIRRKYKRF